MPAETQVTSMRARFKVFLMEGRVFRPGRYGGFENPPLHGV